MTVMVVFLVFLRFGFLKGESDWVKNYVLVNIISEI